MASAAEQLASNINFGAFAKATELKQRIWFTLGALLVYRLGTYIPLPGINPEAFASAFQNQAQGILGGLDISGMYPELGQAILMCVTETKTVADLDQYAQQMERILSKRREAPPCAYKS